MQNTDQINAYIPEFTFADFATHSEQILDSEKACGIKKNMCFPPLWGQRRHIFCFIMRKMHNSERINVSLRRDVLFFDQVAGATHLRV